jgi:hypothetical protein
MEVFMKKNLDCRDFDAVKMARKRRNRYYKTIENMTAEEKREFDRKELARYYKKLQQLQDKLQNKEREIARKKVGIFGRQSPKQFLNRQSRLTVLKLTVLKTCSNTIVQ